MAQIKISKSIINAISNKENENYVENVSNKVANLFSLAIEKLSRQISYVSPESCVLQPVNELISGAMIDNSTFTYFLGINSAQIELNTTNKSAFWKNVFERLKNAWSNRRLFRKKRKRRKKKKDQENEIQEFKFDPGKYNIFNLTEDLQDALIQFVPESVIVYSKDNLLQIIGKEEFGSNTLINIYVVNYDEDIFKYYAGRKKGFIEVNIDSRLMYLNSKIDLCGPNFVKMIKILNALYYNVNGNFPNQVLIESILNHCPNEYFIGDDIYSVFIKIINYLSFKSLKDIKSINDSSKNILDDIVCGNNLFGYNRMLNSIIDK